MQVISQVIGFIIAIGVLVAVHEYGHFWMARRMGIRVLRFSVGFGKPLWMRRGQDGTEYTLSAIPLGGYVKLLDEREGPVDPAQLSEAYSRKSPWQRILVLVAGPAANFLFAALAYWALFVAGLPAIKPVVGEVKPETVAARAGMRSGDEIVAVGDDSIETREGVVLSILNSVMDGEPVRLQLRARDGAVREASLDIEGQRKALTEPGALPAALGFDFWYPAVPAVVGRVVEGSPAQRAGLAPGDRILAVDGHAVADFPGLIQLVGPNPGKTLVFSIDRAGSRRDVPIEVEGQRVEDRLVGRVGIGPAASEPVPQDMRTIERFGPFEAAGKAVGKTWEMSVLTVRMIWNVVAGDVSVKNLSGPLNIAEFAGFALRQGILSFLSLLAVVSVSLFVLNLLPIPILDGGQIVYQLAELVKGRPLSERAQAVGQQIGILLLLVLMSFAFYNDLSRLFS